MFRARSRPDASDAAVAHRAFASAVDPRDAEGDALAGLDELAAALDELPAAQREVFPAGRGEELQAAGGRKRRQRESRKRYAVLRLRERLATSYADFTRG